MIESSLGMSSRSPETREQMVVRVLRHLQRNSIARFPLGPGATRGRITNIATPLASPLTKMPCAAFSVTAFWQRGEQWLPLVAEQASSEFEMADRTGAARVDAHAADVALTWSHNVHVIDGASVLPAALALLERHGYRPAGVPLLFSEYVLKPGDEVAVCGIGGREPDPASEAAPWRLVIRPSVEFPLALSNLPSAIDESGQRIRPRDVTG